MLDFRDCEDWVEHTLPSIIVTSLRVEQEDVVPSWVDNILVIHGVRMHEDHQVSKLVSGIGKKVIAV